MKPQDWRCPKVGCDLGIEGHDLALVIEHIYEGTPTVDGGTFGAKHARAVADGVARRLGWIDEEGDH